jgi:ABC-type transport system involved in multi-copper enzyme maturation permease subunit
MKKLITIAANTFTEILRQPVYCVIVTAALLLFAFIPPLTMYSLEDDNKFLREIALSTLFLTSLFVSIFASAGAVAEEIENKTIITVVTKPLSRPIFILAKFLGVASAVALAHYLCTIALLMAVRHGVMESVNDTHDWTVIASAGGTLVLSVLVASLLGYFSGWKFSSTVIVLAAAFGTVSIVFLFFFDRNWRFYPAHNSLHLTDVYASFLLFFGAMIITALAVALSSRFNVVVTLAGCIGIFMLGLISDYTFGRFADTSLWAKIAYYIVPNLQVFWVSDAIYEGSTIPAKYILISGLYTICYVTGILSLAIAFFQRRQVG